MAALAIFAEPTLAAIEAASVALAATELPRGYLGMSSIGRPCEREGWYGFRWTYPNEFDAATLWRFEDGHRSEDVMAARLRTVKGVELRTVDPRTGSQFRFTDLGGHFSGHADGLIRGILQAPATMHVWEAKATNEKKQAELTKFKSEVGEKFALAKWDATYYAQAVLYMAYADVTRHYMTVSSPGARTMISVRTDTDLDAARQLREKAERIITAAEPPPKISESPAWYQCKMCSARDLCHGQKIAAVNCRTCIHSTPELDGEARWSCAFHKANIPIDVQRTGCDQHRFIPVLVKQGKQVDANATENWIEYETQDGKKFRNGEHGANSYGSNEIRHLMPSLVGDEITEGMRRDFGAQLVESA